jgi:hypothetical protein
MVNVPMPLTTSTGAVWNIPMLTCTHWVRSTLRIFLGAITAMFLADFHLFPMAWPMKMHHVTSLLLIYFFSFVVPTAHPHTLTTAAALEVGTAVSNTFYLSGQAASIRIPYAVIMSFSNGWGECHPHGAARGMHGRLPWPCSPIFGRGPNFGSSKHTQALSQRRLAFTPIVGPWACIHTYS